MYLLTIMNLSSVEHGIGALLLAGGLIILIPFLIIGVISILYAIGLYGMAKRAGVENAWLSFIPIGNLYIIGSLIGSGRMAFFGNELERPELVLPLMSVAVTPLTMVLTAIKLGFLSPIVILVIAGYTLYANYLLLKRYKEDPVGLFILSIFIPVAWPFIIFSLRNTDPIDGGSYSNYDDYNYEGYSNYGNHDEGYSNMNNFDNQQGQQQFPQHNQQYSAHNTDSYENNYNDNNSGQ